MLPLFPSLTSAWDKKCNACLLSSSSSLLGSSRVCDEWDGGVSDKRGIYNCWGSWAFETRWQWLLCVLCDNATTRSSQKKKNNKLHLTGASWSSSSSCSSSSWGVWLLVAPSVFSVQQGTYCCADDYDCDVVARQSKEEVQWKRGRFNSYYYSFCRCK